MITSDDVNGLLQQQGQTPKMPAGPQYAMMDDEELKRSLSGRRPLLMPPAFGGAGAPPTPANQNLLPPVAANQNIKTMMTPKEFGAARQAGQPYAQAKSFLQRIRDNTQGMNRSDMLQSEAIWGGARRLSESGKMNFKDAFHLLVEQIGGYGLTPAEWSQIAAQAMKLGIR